MSKCPPSFTRLTPLQAKCSLAGKLAARVDRLRDIPSRLGMRPYTVQLVWTRWSGGSRGRGVEEVVQVVPILPTPLVQSVDDLSLLTIEGGSDEQGTLRVSEVSVDRYTEDLLLGKNEKGEDTQRDQNFYWEILYPVNDTESIRRRFTVRGVPAKHTDSSEWVVLLYRASEDRMRDGTPRG